MGQHDQNRVAPTGEFHALELSLLHLNDFAIVNN